VEALCEALRHPVPNLRKEAASALGLLAAPESEAALRAACDDPDVEVQKLAARALARLGARP
jgi:HEAT repeat protein